ncbi:hypothetical protein F5Y08DRAFT_349145 [Xylaria arbuscula]|nr:hypothetical protein F5Y08DRAFT_349145 [Xylaria arbuscula]
MELNHHVDSVSTIVEAISTVLGLEVGEINSLAESSSFVKLGGDSLAAILIAAECQKGGVIIPASIFLRAPSLKEAIAKAEDQLLSKYNTVALIPAPASPLLGGISAKDLLGRIDINEWTRTQLLLLQETSSDEKLNMLTIYQTYPGELDAEFVCNIWSTTILREPLFQDLVVELEISPQQLLLRKTIRVENDLEFQREFQNAALVTGQLSHIAVIHLESSVIGVVWRIHHSFIDGFSARLLQEKITRNLLDGVVTAIPGPSFKETVFALNRLREERKESTKAFWNNTREKFSCAVGDLCLSPQRVYRDDIPKTQSITVEFSERELSAARARTGYTAIVYFAAAWALTLGSFVDADQVYFGMAFSGRDLPILGALAVVGPLISILPLFVQLPHEDDQGTSVGTFLRHIHDTILALNEVQHSDTTEGLDRRFSSVIATQFKEYQQLDQPAPVDPSFLDMQSGIPLNLIIRGQSGLQVLYSTSHYSEQDIKNVCAVFRNGMKYILQGSDEIPLAHLTRRGLMPREMKLKIRQWSNCQSFETLDMSKEDDLVTLFENVVARQPSTVAISCGHGQDVSYDDFDRAASVIARELKWVKFNEPVGVYADRSVNWLVAIFGVLKAGGVYVPLDPSLPASVRHANFVQSCACTVIFPSSTSVSPETTLNKCHILAVDSVLQKNKKTMGQDSLIPSCQRRRIARPDDLAYICFTSGSTGQPKAVQCTHKGLVAFQRDELVRLYARKGVVIGQVMSPVFDGSIHEIFSALTHGATLRLPSVESQDHPFSHIEDCDSAILTPTIANALDPQQYPRLRNVYLVGEAVPQSVSDAWTRNHNVYNMYGPTEATCGATIKKLAPNQTVTLGHPNPSSRVYILDRNQRLLPPGTVGEIYLAGIQVSNGYINLPSENSTRFLADSILPQSGQKMYRTGDYAYRNSDSGEIHIIGRRDRQIKLRGFRLDLGDIEARITKAIPHCGGAAVWRRDDYLVAAYRISSTPMEAIAGPKIRMLIQDALPPYATPRRIMALSDWPLTAAGKLNYKELDKMDNANFEVLQSRRESMTETEKTIVRAVRDLMKLDSSVQVDGDSDLTALGGHSIVQLQLASRISSIIGLHFTVRNVINNPVISSLACVVDEAVKGGMTAPRSDWTQPSCLDRRVVETTFNEKIVSPIERVWYSRYKHNLGTSSFNVSHVSELVNGFDQHAALVSAWTSILARHTILRCRFCPSVTAAGGVERLYFADPPKAQYIDSFDLRATINTEFSLEADYPIRVMVSQTHMLVCVSHIICDYSALSQLFKEFAAAYRRGDGAKAPLQAAQSRYEDKACWNVEVDQVTTDFWRSYLSAIDMKGLPPYMKKRRTSHCGDSLMFQLSKYATQSLDTISRSLRLTKHQIALGLVSLVLQADSPTKQDLILGSPFLGRQEEDMSTIGLFLQPLPIRVPRRSKRGGDLSNASIADFLLAVQDSAQSALSHGVGWAALMSLLSSSGDENLRSAAATPSPNHPLFDAMITFHELTATGAGSIFTEDTMPGVEPLLTWTNGAKFGIMFEFSAVRTSVLTLRIEYDTSIFSDEEVLVMARRFDVGLEYLCQYTTSPLNVKDLEDRLLHEDGTSHSASRVKRLGFGTQLATIV